MKRTILLICGKAGAGKNTVADIINEYISCESFAFATKVKALAKDMGWNGVKDEQGRKLLQDIGTAGRNYNNNIWANDVIDRIYFSTYSYFVISDWRYRNEYEVLNKEFKNVITIRVTGRLDDLGTNSNHESEHGLDNFNTKYTIINDGSMNKLKQRVKDILQMEGLL